MYQVYQTPLAGKNIGVVFGSFAPLHQGHLDAIMRAKKENDGGCIVVVCGFNGDKGENVNLPMKRRYRYVRELFSDDELVAVCGINDTELDLPKYPDGWAGWLQEFRNISENLIASKDAHLRWYVGDKNYADDLTSIGEDAVLLDRQENPICATMIRGNPIKYWDKIAEPFKRVFSTNILVVGTASEGKSTLVKDLGKYFNAPHSYEWARGYMKESCVIDWELDGTDYLAFLEGQYNLNKSLINSPANHGIFFSDTDSMVTRMYAEYYAQDESCALTQAEFEKVAVAADEYTRKSEWNKIFLIATHGVFVDDHERYMKHSSMETRKELYDILCKNIKASGNWDKTVVLCGNYYENFVAIRDYVNEVIANGQN